jgi:serine/threonine-protein kinase RsbW
MRRDLLLSMELRSRPECLCAVRGAVAQVAERLGFAEAECRAVVLALDEALANVIRHAYAGARSGPSRCRFRRIERSWRGASRERLEIVLLDREARSTGEAARRPLEDVRPGAWACISSARAWTR